MSAFYSEEAFFDAWRRGVALAGSRWFGDGNTAPENAATKWDLAPRVDEITEATGWLSSGEAMLLAAMVSFYNSNPGGQMLRERVPKGLAISPPASTNHAGAS